MSRTIIQHKNQEIEVVTRRSRKGSRPMFAAPKSVVGAGIGKERDKADLFASLGGRTPTPNLSTTLPRLSSVEKGRT